MAKEHVYPEGVDWREIEVIHFKYAIVVVIGTADDAIKMLKSLDHNSKENREFAVDCFKDNYGITFVEKGKWPLIALPSLPRTPREIGTLAHEATHAVNHIYNELHAHDEEYGKEVYCQLVGVVVEDVLRWSRTLKKKSKAKAVPDAK